MLTAAVMDGLALAGFSQLQGRLAPGVLVMSQPQSNSTLLTWSDTLLGIQQFFGLFGQITHPNPSQIVALVYSISSIARWRPSLRFASWRLLVITNGCW
jgi:hypothetical protein